MGSYERLISREGSNLFMQIHLCLVSSCKVSCHFRFKLNVMRVKQLQRQLSNNFHSSIVIDERS